VLQHVAVLLLMYTLSLFTQYRQTVGMGSVGQRVLHRLRAELFEKLQGLPLAFFAERRSGDLISRVNNDTDKMYQFFSQSLMQFVG
ncbi:ABC transporter transmembrane domain-containing protein, partial [Streptococcus pneumoniae]|nr:ABC transporter transmembrane domain-containing protein [Streptococcus pneumoniae]